MRDARTMPGKVRAAVVLFATVGAACGGRQAVAPSQVQAGVCPASADSPSAPIFEPALLEARPTARHAMAVSLRLDALPPVEACPGDDGPDARCARRDESLKLRQTLNVQEVACVLGALGSQVDGSVLQPLWYEAPYHLVSGEPVPIGVELGLPLVWDEIQRLARQPFVDHIEPAPRAVLSVGGSVPPPHAECPTNREDTAAKLDRAAGLGELARPAVIEVRDEGVLPATVPCPGEGLCEAGLDSLWDRAIQSTREMTCLNRFLDSVLTGSTAPVGYGALTGSPAAPNFPPFSAPSAATKAFGIGLTLSEAMVAAAHPYVESIWTAPGLQFAPSMPGCPTDTTKAIPALQCPTGKDPIDGKITAADAAAFQQGVGPFAVLLTVAGGATICPLPECATKSCPDRDAVTQYWLDENLASQQCVRASISALGGASAPATFWLIDAFEATLTWAQIQQVASLPHVLRIESELGGAPL
jgi:hypothetical protein